MSRELSLSTLVLQATLAVAVVTPALVLAQKEPPAVPSTSKDAPAADEPKVVEPRDEPSGVPTTSKDAAKPGSTESSEVQDNLEIAKTRFEAFNGVEVSILPSGEIAILDIKEKTTAARSGLKKGDRIVEIDSRPLKSRTNTENYLQETSTQPYHVVRLKRGADEVEVVLGRSLDLLGMLIVPDTGSRPLVYRVERESPAEAAGVHAEDIIIGASGRKIDTYKQFHDFAVPLVRKMSTGQELNLRLSRDAEDIEVSVIRPEAVKLPLIAAPEKPLPGDGTPRRMNPVRTPVIQETQIITDETYVNEAMGLATPFVGTAGVPFIGFGTGSVGPFPSLPTFDAVVAILHPSHTGMTGHAGVNNGIGTGINPGVDIGVPLNSGGTVNPGVLPTTPINPTNDPGVNPNTPIDNGRVVNPGVPPNTPINPRTNNRNTPVNPTNPGPGNRRVVPNQAPAQQPQSLNERQKPVEFLAQAGVPQRRTNNRANTANQGAGVLQQPTTENPTVQQRQNAVNNLGNGTVGVDPTLTSGTVSGTGGFNGRGFVMVGVNTGIPFIQARVAGLPQGTYSLVIHQFGDCGDVAQNSSGPIIAVLATFQTGADGRANISQNLNQAVLPSALLGRVVSVVSGAFDQGTNSFGQTTTTTQETVQSEPDGNPLTDEGATTPPVESHPQTQVQLKGLPMNDAANPGQTPGINVVGSGVELACGVFGVSSPTRVTP